MGCPWIFSVTQEIEGAYHLFSRKPFVLSRALFFFKQSAEKEKGKQEKAGKKKGRELQYESLCAL